MKPLGRRAVALVGLAGILAWGACGTAPASADTVKSDVDLSTKDIGSRETPMGDLVADAIRSVAKSDVAFIAASSFAEVTLPKGSLATADILRALDYKSDEIDIVKLTGDQMRQALEHSLFLYPTFNSGFLQVSGLVVTINPDAEKEHHIVSVRVNGDPLDPTKSYKVAMPAPLANGALTYFKFWKKSDIQKGTDRTLESAVSSYLTDHKSIAKGDDRLVIKGH